ncbi:MAG: HD domain-containing protein, partial [Sandaracinaceae bacterium]
LGLTSLVFPGAEHSRFAHAVGTAHVMVKLIQHVRDREASLGEDQRLDAEAERDALAAALLHDLGHGPFSHLFEEVIGGSRHHEEWTWAILRDPETDVHAELEQLGAGTAERVARLLEGEHRIGWLPSTVSGTIDVDRCDYLLRDSHMTGARYGLYDLDWLQRALVFAQLEGEGEVLAIEGRKGLPAAESFFLARQFMYGQVYHHKATRAAECLIRATFIRLAEVIRDGAPPEGTPDAMRAAILGEPLSVEQYLDLDDPMLMSAFFAWERAADPLLADLAARLRHRRLPKTLPLPDGPEDRPRWIEARDRAAEIARAHGLRDDLWVWLDEPADTSYTEPPDDPRAGLWVVLRHQPLRRLGDVSFLLRQLKDQTIVRPRLVFPEEIREDVERAVEGLLA